MRMSYLFSVKSLALSRIGARPSVEVKRAASHPRPSTADVQPALDVSVYAHGATPRQGQDIRLGYYDLDAMQP